MKNLKFIQHIVILLVIITMILSCAVDEGPFVDPSCNPGDTEAFFGTDIQPIFNASCIACHNETHPKLNLQECCSYVELTVTGFSAPYVDAANPTSSKLYKHLTGELLVMPPSGSLPEHQINKVLKWIELGALNN